MYGDEEQSELAAEESRLAVEEADLAAQEATLPSGLECRPCLAGHQPGSHLRTRRQAQRTGPLRREGLTPVVGDATWANSYRTIVVDGRSEGDSMVGP